MNQFKFSFARGKPISFIIDNSGNIKHIIKIVENKDDEPDIIVDKKEELFSKNDFTAIVKSMGLNSIEKQIFNRCVKENKCATTSLRVKQAFSIYEDMVKNKLMTELDFDENLNAIPAIGFADYDRSIYIVASSGSGKSFLLKQIIKHDQKKRKGILFSKVANDKSLKDIVFDSKEENEFLNDKKNPNNKRLIHFKLDAENDQDPLELLKLLDEGNGTLVIFDDINTIKKKEDVLFLKQLNADILETGRHDNISSITTSHTFKDGAKLKKDLLSESEWIILFPSTNKLLSERFLNLDLGIPMKKRKIILSKTAKNRYMAVRMSNPNVILHSKGAIII